MADKEKISVIVLGNEDSLKKALIAIILGKNPLKVTKTSVLKTTEIYENDIYIGICTPDLYTESDDIRQLFAINRYPDMSLLVIEDGLSDGKVWEQIEKLSHTTGKPTQEFRVVLPFSYNQSDSHVYKFYTIEQLFTELRKLTERRQLTSTNSRPAPVQIWPNMPPSCTPMEVTEKYADTPVNLFLLGMSGTGKSASGNTILGKNHFPSRASSQPVTKEFQVVETVIDGKHIRVFDTPDMFDDDIEPAVKNKHVKKCRELWLSGPSVFVLVMHVSRFTDGERDILKKMERAFGPRVQEQTVILITRGDDLKRAGMRLENFLSSCQPDLRKIVAQCGNRCVVFENRTSDSRQVKELMQKVENVLGRQQAFNRDYTRSSFRRKFLFF